MDSEEPSFANIKTEQRVILREFFDFAMENKKIMDHTHCFNNHGFWSLAHYRW